MKLSGILYRIMTEDLNRSKVCKIASKYFDGFTIRPNTIGYWKGAPEKSITIEIVTGQGAKVKKLAREIKALNKQEAILIDAIQNNAQLI